MQKYRAMALETMKQIHDSGKIPIVCGGTNYYIESLMFEQEVSVLDKSVFLDKVKSLKSLVKSH